MNCSRQMKQMAKSKFLDKYKANFETLKRACNNGDVALAYCRDRISGRDVSVLVAVTFDGTEYTFAPLAKMFDGNPYEELLSPEETLTQDEKRA